MAGAVWQHHSMETDKRVIRRYELDDEANRLWRPGIGELIRLRTWDIFDRMLPQRARIADIGGGPGTHAARLSDLGNEVVLIDPVERHIEQAKATTGGKVECVLGDARSLDLADSSFDAALLMGPLYHLPDPSDRLLALREAHRVLHPGGVLISEVLPRHSWILNATRLGLLGDPEVLRQFDTNLETGMRLDPDSTLDGGFYAYLHRVDEVASEHERSGFRDVRLIGVEGHAWLLGNLPELLNDTATLFDVLRLVESEPELLGMSGHLIAVAHRP